MKTKYKKVKIHKKHSKKNKNNLSCEFQIYTKIIKLFIIISLTIIFIYNYDKTKSNYNYVHLAVNLDDKYLYPGIVFFTSLLDNRAKSTFYIIHVLTNSNLTNESKNKVNTIIERFGNKSVELKFYNFTENDFKGATVNFISIATYYKIALPSLLPNLDKIIYCDSDMINLEDLSELYNITFKENMYFCGITDYKNHLTQLEEFGLTSNKYINIGVMLMNLKGMRENSIEKKLRDFIATHNLAFFDQTAINCVCYENTQVLPYKYNVFAFEEENLIVELNNQQEPQFQFNESEVRKAYNEPTLFHYANLAKPWLKETTKFNRVYWWYYAKMSGFYQEILDHYGFNKNEIEELLKLIPEDGGMLKRNYKNLNNIIN